MIISTTAVNSIDYFNWQCNIWPLDDHISYVILYQLFNVSNLSLYNQARNWVAFQYSSVVSQSPSDHTTSGLYLFTISYSSGIVFVCKIKAKKLQKHYIDNDRKKKFKNQKCEEKYSELKECNFFFISKL